MGRHAKNKKKSLGIPSAPVHISELLPEISAPLPDTPLPTRHGHVEMKTSDSVWTKGATGPSTVSTAPVPGPGECAVSSSSKAQTSRDGSETSKRIAAVVEVEIEGSTSPRYPEWVMLNKAAGISPRHRNETTADSHTSQGQAVEVSFWLADPPAVSHFSVHCPGLQGDDFSDQPPVVICAEGPFVLFSLTLNVPEWGSIHHFVYSAGGPAGSPSLRLLPVLDPEVEAFESQQFALLPCGGQHYAVVFLDRNWIPSDEVWEYQAYLYSSKMRAWSTTKVPLSQLSETEKALLDGHYSCKQIMVGPDSLGWVDLLCGIVLLCNLFDENPVIKFIPFPSTRICITDEDGVAEIAAEHVCDVTCCGDLIKFVQIDFDDPDYGSSGIAWKATTWNRKLSWNDWRNRCIVDLLDDETQQLQLKNLIFINPTISTQDDTRLYMMAKVNMRDDTAWVVAIDMKHAALEALVPISTERHYTVTMCAPCAFPKYLNNFTADTYAPKPPSYFRLLVVCWLCLLA
uniref:Uncharacterized protein n=1 Tax=Aegilops tauschii TaxID=37682 RepID=N1QUH0_AEGTA